MWNTILKTLKKYLINNNFSCHIIILSNYLWVVEICKNLSTEIDGKNINKIITRVFDENSVEQYFKDIKNTISAIHFPLGGKKYFSSLADNVSSNT